MERGGVGGGKHNGEWKRVERDWKVEGERMEGGRREGVDL